MTFKEAILATTVRFMSLVIAMLCLVIPARILREMFFPDGLSGDVVMLIVMFLLAGCVIVFFTYVLAPVLKWWQSYEEERRTHIQRNRD